jgi:uncharacterized protein (DUF1330 family)
MNDKQVRRERTMVDGLSAERLDRYLQEDPGGPVSMLNLLRFKPDGGRERYFEYAEAIHEIGQRVGLKRVFVGMGGTALVAEPGQEWDAVAIVEYPSRQAFVDMVRSPEYRAAAHLRTESLIEATLQPTQAL